MTKTSYLAKIYMYMSSARRQKRKQQHEVKKMYEKQMRLMSTMTDEQRITHLAHLQSRIKPMEQKENDKL
jgi:hypothetical protein